MKKLPKIPASQITDESLFFMKRRQLLKALGIGAAGLTVAATANAGLFSWFSDDTPAPPMTPRKPLTFIQPEEFQPSLTLTPEDKVIGYNNFYEFGLGKSDPAENAHTLVTDEWTVTIDGEVNRPLTLNLDDINTKFPLEERIYRMRCVEAWSMVIPWVGFPLAKLLALVEPTSKAKYVAFETRYAPEQMPGQKKSLYWWWLIVPLC